MSSAAKLFQTSIIDQLRTCLTDLEYVGSIAAFQTRQRIVDPGLHVNGVGNIRLPLDAADAKEIMAAGTQDPSNTGSGPILNTKSSYTKDLNPSQFQLRNPAWEQEVQDIVAHLGQMLGFQDNTPLVKPELSELLLYEQGAMLKAHKESEKAHETFGTLVICLPSKHSGGSVLLSHQGEILAFGTAPASEFGQSHIAWYSDVVHEMKPVESGSRLVLKYNLVRTGYGEPMFANTLVEEKTRCRRILANWKQNLNAGQPALCRLVWILDHKYTEVSLRELTGHDDLVGRHMAEVSQKEGFTILFATMIHQKFAADTLSESPPYQELVLENVVEADGSLKIDSATIQREEIIQANCLDRLADSFEKKQWTIQHYGWEHYFHDTVYFDVMLIMPEAFALEFELGHASDDDIMIRVSKLIESLENDPEQEHRKTLKQICIREANAAFNNRHEWFIACIIEACTALKDAQVLLMAIRGCSTTRPGSHVHLQVSRALHDFPFSEIKPSLDELTRYDTKLHLNLSVINNICSFYEYRNSENRTLSALLELKVWEKARIEDVIQRANQLEPEDAGQLVEIVKRHGKEMADKHVLPLLKKHDSCAEALISCLSDIFEAGRSGEIPRDTAELIFENAIHATTANLSLRASHPKHGQEETKSSINTPGYQYYTWDNLSSSQFFPPRVVRFYCQCVYTHHENEATAVLVWLKDVVDTADVRLFHDFIFGFLIQLGQRMQEYGLHVSETLQEACQHMVLAFLHRYVGMEPAMDTTWTRPPRGCGNVACLHCTNLDDFLRDPEKEIEYFGDGTVAPEWINHLLRQASAWPWPYHECTPDYKMEDGRTMLRIKKSKEQWIIEYQAWKPKYDAWKHKYANAVSELESLALNISRPLLGDRYEELMEMRPIRLPTGS